MGVFGSLFGWDQSMGAVNAVLANHLVATASNQQRKRIATEVGNIISSVQRRDINTVLRELSQASRAIQMNFVALACDNLGISPPIPNNVWTRVNNPYVVGTQVDNQRINAAIAAIKKQDGVTVSWPGTSTKINFVQMLEAGHIDDPKVTQETSSAPNLVIREIDRRSQSSAPPPVAQPEAITPKVAPPAFTATPKTVLSTKDREIINDLKLAGWTVAFNGKSWTFRYGQMVREIFDADELRLFAKKPRSS